MVLGVIDYTSSYFKYIILTSMREEPTNKTLKQLEIELQVNNSSVEMDLGGDKHGYLGLVLSNEEYASITNTQPFITPTYPQLLIILADTTAIQALELKDAHNERKHINLECKSIEKALLFYLQDATEDRYIEFLVDEYTIFLQTMFL